MGDATDAAEAAAVEGVPAETSNGLRRRKTADLRAEFATSDSPKPSLQRQASVKLVTDPNVRKISMRAVWFACFVDVCCLTILAPNNNFMCTQGPPPLLPPPTFTDASCPAEESLVILARTTQHTHATPLSSLQTVPCVDAHPESFPDTKPFDLAMSINLIPASGAFGKIIASYFIVRLSKKIGRKPALLLCLLGGAACCIFKYLLRGSYLGFIAANFVNGLFGASIVVGLAYIEVYIYNIYVHTCIHTHMYIF